MSTIKEQLSDIQAKVSALAPAGSGTTTTLNLDTSLAALTDAQSKVTALPTGGPVDSNIAPIAADIKTRLTDIQAKVNAFGSAPVMGSATEAQVLAVVADLLAKTATLASGGSTDTNAVTVLTGVQAQIVTTQASIAAMVISTGTGGNSTDTTRIIAGINSLLNQDGLPAV